MHVLLWLYPSLYSMKLGDGGKGIPFEDRQAALGLLLELSLQRGSLQHMLDTVLLLLRLSDAASKNRPRFMKSEDDVPRKRPPGQEDYGLMSGDEVTCPLVPFLRRLGGIKVPPSAEIVSETTTAVSCLELYKYVCFYVFEGKRNVIYSLSLSLSASVWEEHYSHQVLFGVFDSPQ